MNTNPTTVNNDIIDLDLSVTKRRNSVLTTMIPELSN